MDRPSITHNWHWYHVLSRLTPMEPAKEGPDAGEV